MKAIKIILISLLLASCASAYKPTGKMLRIKNSMNHQQALSIFHQAFNQQSKDVNLCAIPYLTDRNVKPVPTDEGYRVKAYRQGKLIGTEVIGGVTYNKYEKIYYTAYFNLSEVKTVRIRENDDSINRIVACKPEFGDKKILLYTTSTTFTTIVTTNDEFNRVLAAITILSPNARLIQGLGF